MRKKFRKIFLIIIAFILTPFLLSQSMGNVGQNQLDQDFLESLPESVRQDVLNEIQKSNEQDSKNLQKRPSTELSKLTTIKQWEDFQKSQLKIKSSERYGIKLFNSMQSSFMPLNEPNFGINYVLDYGDVLEISLFGSSSNNTFSVEISRDGTIFLEDIGKVSVAGLNYEQASNLIKQKY